MWHDLWQIWENFHVSLIVAASVDPGQCSKIFWGRKDPAAGLRAEWSEPLVQKLLSRKICNVAGQIAPNCLSIKLHKVGVLSGNCVIMSKPLHAASQVHRELDRSSLALLLPCRHVSRPSALLRIGMFAALQQRRRTQQVSKSYVWPDCYDLSCWCIKSFFHRSVLKDVLIQANPDEQCCTIDCKDNFVKWANMNQKFQNERWQPAMTNVACQNWKMVVNEM